MFEKLPKILLRDLKNRGNGKKFVIAENQSVKKTTEEKILDANWENNVFFINIMTDCTLEEYCDYLNEMNIETVVIPLRLLLMNGYNLLTARLKKQKICIFQRDNSKYLISSSFDNINLSERRMIDNFIHEIVIKLNYRNDNYEYGIEKYIYDLNGSTKLCKWYPMKSYRDDRFLLDKEEGLREALIVLERVMMVREVYELFNRESGWNLNFIYDIFNKEISQNKKDSLKKELVYRRKNSN